MGDDLWNMLGLPPLPPGEQLLLAIVAIVGCAGVTLAMFLIHIGL